MEQRRRHAAMPEMPNFIILLSDGGDQKGVVVGHVRVHSSQLWEALVMYHKGHKKGELRFCQSVMLQLHAVVNFDKAQSDHIDQYSYPSNSEWKDLA